MTSKNELSVRRLDATNGAAAVELAGKIPEAAKWAPAEVIRQPRSEYAGWVALDEGRIVGFVVTRQAGDETELLSIGVDPHKRRRGIASRLLSAALGKARDTSAGNVHLEVRASNAIAIAFYERAGFRFSGRRRNYYSNPREDAVLMALELSA